MSPSEISVDFRGLGEFYVHGITQAAYSHTLAAGMVLKLRKACQDWFDVENFDQQNKSD